MELDQRIKQELEENPALEEGADDFEDEFEQEEEFDDADGEDEFDLSDYLDDDVADYKTQANNHSKDDEERVIPLSGEQSFQEKLTEQLHLLYLEDEQFTIADVIIGNLDESGYLNRSIDAIVDDLAFSMNVDVSEKAVMDIPEVVMVHGISGPEDFMLVVVARDLDHYSEVLQKRLHRLPSVRQVHTHFSLQDFKGQIGNLPIPPA